SVPQNWFLPKEWSCLLQDLVASAQQRAFWLANEIDPATPAFNLLRVLQLKGMVHKHILARAFDDLIARHEVLRTGLVERNGMVLQHVHDKISLAIEEQDFSSLSEAECRMRLDALAVRMSQTAFDLAAPPHLRVALARLSEDEHVLV